MRQITVEARIENGAQVVDFVNEELIRIGCPDNTQIQIDIALDEIFSNIANYAYGDSAGEAMVSVDYDEPNRTVILSFYDNGAQYNPLESEEPDITLSAEERQIGGLGIFMVKKMMDQVLYDYKDNQNILTIRKVI